MSLGELAHARRTHKAFGAEPVGPDTLLELFELAQLAPNHHLTHPWRFRVLGRRPCTPEGGAPAVQAKARARPRSSRSRRRFRELIQDEEDICAVAAITLIRFATERPPYWRTPASRH